MAHIPISNVMKKENRNEELQSRREFFKKAAKGALPILGIVAFGPSLLSSCENGYDEFEEENKTTAQNSSNADEGSGEGCTDCTGKCTDGCKSGCKTGCRGTCYKECKAGMKLGCNTCKTQCGNVCKGYCSSLSS